MAFCVSDCSLPPLVTGELCGELELRVRNATHEASAMNTVRAIWWGAPAHCLDLSEQDDTAWATALFPLFADVAAVGAYLRDAVSQCACARANFGETTPAVLSSPALATFILFTICAESPATACQL
jgi:hypothetical protein